MKKNWLCDELREAAANALASKCGWIEPEVRQRLGEEAALFTTAANRLEEIGQ